MLANVNKKVSYASKIAEHQVGRASTISQHLNDFSCSKEGALVKLLAATAKMLAVRAKKVG